MSLCYLLPMSLCRANYYPYLSFPEYETRNIRYVDGYYVYPSEIGSEGPTATHVRSLDLTSWEEVSGFQELVEEPWASIGDIGLGYFDPVFDDISGEYDPYITFDGGETYTVIPSNFLVQDIIATEDAFYLCQSYKITELSLIDLSVQNVAIRYDETPGPDVPITVEFDVSNLGLVDYLRTGELKVSVVLTQSEFLDAGANYTLFESTLEPPLAVGESLHFSQEVYLPRELSAGDFHIGVFADSADRLSELNESNNIYFSPTSLINIPHVTLTVNSADGGSVLAGSSLPNGLALSDGSSGLSVLSGALELPFNLQLNLLAQPAKNYVFAGWEEYPNQGEDPLNLNLTTDITLTPVFRSLISVSTSVQGSGTVQTTPTDTSDSLLIRILVDPLLSTWHCGRKGSTGHRPERNQDTVLFFNIVAILQPFSRFTEVTPAGRGAGSTWLQPWRAWGTSRRSGRRGYRSSRADAIPALSAWVDAE